MKRRKFIILTGLGATSGAMLSACGNPERKLIPALIPDEEYVPGIDYWKASACAMCAAGCGILVRTREHRANKIEGNPNHPVNRGALCARGQAGLHALYNPDRIRAPLKRAGERGAGQFDEISWDEAIKTLAAHLREIKAQGRAGSVVFATEEAGGVTGLAAEIFMQAYGSKLLAGARLLDETWDRTGYEMSYGRRANPTFDIANARYLLSFGARFLETWHSPVMYSLAYGEFRRSPNRVRGKFVQVEPRMSLTAANADEWLPAAVGTEALVALAIAQVIIREGLVKEIPDPGILMRTRPPGPIAHTAPQAITPDLVSNHLEAYAPELTASLTDIPAEKIIRIAREFASTQPALAIGSGSNLLGKVGDKYVSRHLEQVDAIHYLNHLVGNIGKPGGVLLSTSDGFDPLAKWRGKDQSEWLPVTGDVIASSNVSALLIHQTNPVHAAPRMADRIKTIPLVVSFSSFMDETVELADLILPDHTYLESWDIKAAHSIGNSVTVTLAQPVVKPEFNTKQTGDVLIALKDELGYQVTDQAAFLSAEELVKQSSAELMKLRGSISADDAESFWETFVERGVWTGEIGNQDGAQSAAAPAALPAGHALDELSRREDRHVSDEDYPFVLIAYEHAALGFGSQANLPWLQELPDPMTSVMWGSWVEINPKTAASLGIADGDLVEVRTTEGAVEAAAVVYPAIRPDCIAMPCGQGHTAYGRYASGRGVNAALLAPFTSGAGAASVRAKVSKLPGKANLIRFGTSLPEHIETKR